ncbi:hypothetical protein O6H91_10G081900 [Diphasiastrum complanatum]|uniref:Uncharacterized protein n=1 Tax=Diphasiastrum complanatum TaxID=34168 RepID=A0ACC2CJ52_DIPCM|nr:hypothetical protein O6H91_10G081900 [Diphasiastrum complanatum]
MKRPYTCISSCCNRAIAQKAYGQDPVQVLEVEERGIPSSASPGHVVIRLNVRCVLLYDLVVVRDSHLQHVITTRDIHDKENCIRGDVDLKSSDFKQRAPVPGLEGCGRVYKIGEGVTKYTPGQRVVPILFWDYLNAKGQGAWQDYVEVAEHDVLPVPDSISDEVAAQFVMNECAVYGALVDLQIPKGEWLLQTAANSNFGRQTIQLAKHWGIKTINIVRRDDLVEELKALGADVVINSSKTDVLASVKKITGDKGVYGAIDAVSGTMTKTVAACVRDGGQVFMVGELSGTDLVLSTIDLLREVSIRYWSITSVFQAERRNEVAKDVWKLLEDKIISPLLGKSYELTKFKDAIDDLEVQKSGGRILLIG